MLKRGAATLLRPIAGVALAIGLAIGISGEVRAMMKWRDLTDRPRPQPSARLSYGPDPLQHVDIWLPDRAAPFPVVLMVHGGCWQTSVADATLMNYAAEDLRKRGIAVWNIEYRGVDRAGGGYPGTFLDAAAAADALRANAARYHLDTRTIVGIGHSAGGHLLLWLAGRGNIAADSPLHAADPLHIATAISIGGLPDLEAALHTPEACGTDAVLRMAGPATPARPDVYSDTSPAELLPFATRQVLVNADKDPIAPPEFADAYARRARRHGVTVRHVVVPDEGHVELIAPGSVAWAAEVREIERALRRS